MTSPHERIPTNAILGRSLETGKRVALKDKHRVRHVCIIGRTGYGKTTTLEHLILEDLHCNTSAVLIDPHGDLSERIISLASEEQQARITLLEVWPDRPFRLNLLEYRDDPATLTKTVDDILTLFRRLFNPDDRQIGQRLNRYLGDALYTLIPNHGTLADVQRLFYDDTYRRGLLANIPNRQLHDSWLMYEQIPPRDRAEQLESTVNRLGQFLRPRATYAMVSSPETTVPLTKVLNSDGQLLIVRIPVGELGEQQARFYGSLFLSLLTDRLFARAELPKSKRPRLHLYLDEYGWFATTTTAALLQQARKYNLGATIAFQTLADLPDEINTQAALQVGTHVLLRLTGPDADELVSQFPVIPRREIISESVGYKKITGLARSPVEHLLTNPHNNPQANEAAETFLRPMQDIIERKTRPTFISDLPPDISQEHAQEIIRRINELLVSVMEQKQDLTDASLAHAAADIFTQLTLHYPSRYPCDIGPSGNPALHSTEFTSKLGLHLQQAATGHSLFNSNPSVSFKLMHFGTKINPNTVWRWLTTCAEQYHDEGLKETPEPSLPFDDTIYSRYDHTAAKRHVYSAAQEAAFSAQFKANNAWRARGFHEAEKRKHTETISQYADRIEADAAELITLCKILAAEPIHVPTGQEIEEFRDRTHLQSFADARVELAGILANLEVFTAYYQTPKSHGQVKLAKPLGSDELDEEAIEEVRKRSKQLYGVPIEDELPLEAPLSETPRPRISRRPPQQNK